MHLEPKEIPRGLIIPGQKLKRTTEDMRTWHKHTGVWICRRWHRAELSQRARLNQHFHCLLSFVSGWLKVQKFRRYLEAFEDHQAGQAQLTYALLHGLTSCWLQDLYRKLPFVEDRHLLRVVLGSRPPHLVVVILRWWRYRVTTIQLPRCPRGLEKDQKIVVLANHLYNLSQTSGTF